MPTRPSRRRRLIASALGLAALAGVAGSSGPVAAEAARAAPAMSAGAGPFGITTGPDGNLWFTEIDGGNRIGRVTPQGAVTEFSRGISPGAGPAWITTGPDGNLWFTEARGDRIGRITTRGVVTEFRGISPRSYPAGITTGPDGNLWFTEAEGNRVGRITPGGQVTEFSAGITPESAPLDIAVGSDGNLWFTESQADRIGRITTQGVVTEFPLGIPLTRDRFGLIPRPGTIAAGPDGNLWFTLIDGHRIGRITPAGAVTVFPAHLGTGSACGIAAGPDGNMWFTEAEGNRIGRIHPSGEVTVVRGPRPYVPREASDESSYPRCGIARGPDGNVWFTEWESDLIGRVTPAGIVSELPPVAAVGAVRLRGTSAVAVRLRCPSGAVRACGGVLRVWSTAELPPRRLGARRIRVAPGRTIEVTVPLTAAGRRLLRARGELATVTVLFPGAPGTAGAVEREAVIGRRRRAG